MSSRLIAVSFGAGAGAGPAGVGAADGSGVATEGWLQSIGTRGIPAGQRDGPDEQPRAARMAAAMMAGSGRAVGTVGRCGPSSSRW